MKLLLLSIRSRFGFFCLLTVLMAASLACSLLSAGPGGGSPPSGPGTAPGQPAPASLVPTRSVGTGGVKLLIKGSGLVEVSGDQLAAAGLSPERLPQAAGSGLRLSLRGRLLPVQVEGQGAALRLRFYAPPVDSLHTETNVFLLELGAQAGQSLGELVTSTAVTTTKAAAPAPALPTVPPLQKLPAESYLAVQHAEQNLLYNPQADGGDHWLWAVLPAPKKQDFPVTLNAVVPGEARLRLALWGSSEADQKPDHHLLVSVNGQAVADQSWDGKGRLVLEAVIPAGALKEGPNTVTLQAPGDTGAPADITYLDWFEISYPRRFQAEAGRLEFTSPGGKLNLAGFSGKIRVFDVTDPFQAAPAGELAGGQGTFEAPAGRRYRAADEQGMLKPAAVSALINSPDLRSATAGADYVAVGPADLLQPLQPLLDYRQSSGLKTLAVPLDAVFDQFNAGLPEPEAIRQFMKYAQAHWKPAPRFLLLVGSGTYDPRGFQAPAEANRLPVFLINTVFGGETASDVVFTQLDESGKPSLAVGRIPARTPQQVTAVVEKTLAFEKAGSENTHRVLAVADGTEATFRSDAQSFLGLFPKDYQLDLFAPDAGTTGANQQVVERINNGDRLVAYFGHGSVNMWGKDRLFSIDDIPNLNNSGRLPVVINMTCLTGLFTHPKAESLAAALIFRPGGGAVAVLAPTSLTLPTDQSILSKPLVQKLLDDPSATLGEALLYARQQVPLDTPGARDVMQTFLLFGDPALKVKP